MTLLTGSIKGIDRAFAKFEKQQITATFRTLNIQGARANKKILQELSKITNTSQKELKKGMSVSKASRLKQRFIVMASQKRNAVGSAKVIKGGVSFKYRKKTVKLTNSIGGGSKPFIITGRSSGKKVAVYRSRGSKKTSTIRKSTTPHLFGTIGIDSKKYNSLFVKGLAKTYKEQLERAGFTKRRKRK